MVDEFLKLLGKLQEGYRENPDASALICFHMSAEGNKTLCVFGTHSALLNLTSSAASTDEGLGKILQAGAILSSRKAEQ